jgi:hypothetical protein
MDDRLLRARALLDEQFAVVVAILVVLALVGGWVTYTTYATPDTTSEERTVSSWRTAGSFNHSATVTESNSVYPVGTTLTNRSIYFAEIAPRLDGIYTFTYDASDRGDLNGTVSLEVVLRSVEETQDRSTVVWRTSEPLRTVSEESLRPGEPIRVPFSIDMNGSLNRSEVITEELDNPPGQPELLVRATVDIRGTVNGQRVNRTAAHTLPVALGQGAYRPDSPGRITNQYETTRSVTVQQSYGPVRTVGGPALVVGPLGVLVGLVAARHRNRIALSPAERSVLDYEDERADFDEWISTIQLPDDAFDRPQAEAASLGALVDFAIDTDNGVIEDPDDNAYYVIHDGYLYTYQPPALRDGRRRTVPTEGEHDDPDRTDGESPVVPTMDDESGAVDGTPEDE